MKSDSIPLHRFRCHCLCPYRNPSSFIIMWRGATSWTHYIFAQVTLLTCSIHLANSARTFFWMRILLNFGSQLLELWIPTPGANGSGVQPDTCTWEGYSFTKIHVTVAAFWSQAGKLVQRHDIIRTLHPRLWLSTSKIKKAYPMNLLI